MKRGGCCGGGGGGYIPYFDPDFDSLIERIDPPRVCVDNDTRADCTLVKVDSPNKHGILLEMVQVLSDLDLVISKSYISSDGRWFMEVFHVTDQLGYKLSDESIIHYIQRALVSRRRGRGRESGGREVVVRTCLGRVVGPRHLEAEHTALELMGADRPGVLSEVSAVLVQLGCHVVSAKAWSHNSRVACVLYVGDHTTGEPISDRSRLARMEEQLENVVGAHHGPRERWQVRLTGPTAGRVHTERRLHQLMHEDRDFEVEEAEEDSPPTTTTTVAEARRRNSRAAAWKMAAKVSIDSCEEKGYSVVSIRSRDRPKLLFDTVCTLTDMDYVVFHATVSSHGPLAVQEYYIRRMDGCALDSESERRRVTRCLAAAIERRVSHGLRLNVCTPNRIGLLWDVTRVFREHALSMTRVDISARGESGVGAFYVTDASGGQVDLKTVDSVREEIGGTLALEVDDEPQALPPVKINTTTDPSTSGGSGGSTDVEERQRFSLGNVLWSQIERFSNNFGSIKY